MNKKLYRSQTPGCSHRIHLNNAGASLCPQPVIDAIQKSFDLEHRIGGYEAMVVQAKQSEMFYRAAAKLFNCKPGNIALVQHSTEALNKALLSVPLQKGDCILTTEDDYFSFQIAFLQMQKRFGIKVLRTPALPEGGYDPEAMKTMIEKHRPKIICVAHIPTSSGLVQDVNYVGQLCEEHDTIYIIDACQSIGQIPLDVQQMKCDFLCASTRKFLRGPRGAGLLYVSDKILNAGLEPLFMDGMGSQWTGPDSYQAADTARRFETFERSYPLMEGSRVAIEYALDVGLEHIEKEVTELAAYTRQQLAELPNAVVLDRGKKLCGIVTAHFKDQDPDRIQQYLLENKINTSITRKHMALIDFEKKQVDWALRIAPHYYNTREEIDTTVEFLRKL